MACLRITKLDFFTIKTQLLSYFLLVAIILMLGFMGSPVAVLCITGAWFIALQASNIFAIQEKNNLECLYGSVSVALKDIVLGRYIFMLLNYSISFLVVVALYIGFALYRNNAINLTDIMLGFSLSFFIFSAITGIQMPLFFKMGYAKAKIMALVPFLIIMLLVIIPSFINILSDLVQLAMANQGMIIAVGIIASCIIQFVSYKVAVIACRKRK